MTEPVPISVLVCSAGRRAMLQRLVRDLIAQDYEGEYEIVVVEETDDPCPIEGVRYLPHPVQKRGIAYARNLALANAKYDWVAFVDDDCRMPRHWLRHLAAFARKGVVAAQGGVRVPQDSNAIGWAECLLGVPGGGLARIAASGGKPQRTTEVSTLNALYWKPAVQAAGGFDERARLGGEDWLLARRLAGRGEIWFVPDAVVEHAPRGSLLRIVAWFVRRGRAEAALWRAGLAPELARFWLRGSLALKLLAALLLAPWWGAWPLGLLLVGKLAGTWWRLRWALQRREVPKKAWWVAPIVQLAMDIGADLGRVQELLQRRKA